MTTSFAAAPRRFPRRLTLLLGLGLALAGVLGYAAQLAARHLKAPWYLPCLATLGAALVIASLWQARTAWRVLALLLAVLLAGAAWAFLLMTRLPPYTGPVAAGQPFPAFTTVRANGTPFTHKNLEGGESSVRVFFRGRW